MTVSASLILSALGGSANVLEIEPCVTRLRVVLKDPTLLDTVSLRHIGAHGVISSGNAVQVVIGPEADVVASEIEDIVWSEMPGLDSDSSS